MNSRIRFFLASFTILALRTASSFAESPGIPPAPVPSAPGNVPYVQPAKGTSNISVFDDRVFEFDKPGKEKPTTTQSPNSGTIRQLADTPNYNTNQRQTWLETCSPFKDKGNSEYSKCYEDEKKKTENDVRRKLDAVEKKSKEPPSTIGPSENMRLRE